MRTYVCRLEPFDETLQYIPNTLRLTISFEFALTPAEVWGQPDQDRHTQTEIVRVVVTNRALKALATDADKRVAALYWHATKALERGDSELTIDVAYATANSIDVSRVVYPPSEPFCIERPIPMGFHAIRRSPSPA